MNDGQERTEPATPRRRERARAEGDVPRSALASYAVTLWLVAPALSACGSFAIAWVTFLGRSVDAAVHVTRWEGVPSALVAPIAVGWAAALTASIASSAACGALGWSPGALRWRMRGLSPIGGARSIVGGEAIKQCIFAFLITSGLVFAAIASTSELLDGVAALHEIVGAVVLGATVLKAFWLRAALVVSIVAIIEVVLARRRHAHRLRMTPREVREERAEQEGRPEHKARRRAMAMRRNRRLRVAALKRACAVITNPTHVAVALQYAPPVVDVPVVLAIGAGAGAAILRTAAAYYDVPIVESPELARTLFGRVDVDEPIPEELYAGIAAVFAWILRTRGSLGPALDATP